MASMRPDLRQYNTRTHTLASQITSDPDLFFVCSLLLTQSGRTHDDRSRYALSEHPKITPARYREATPEHNESTSEPFLADRIITDDRGCRIHMHVHLTKNTHTDTHCTGSSRSRILCVFFRCCFFVFFSSAC